MKNLIHLLIAAAFLTGISSSAFAQLIAYESFDETASTALAGTTADSGLGAWTSASGSAATYTSPGLTSGSLVVGGNKVSFSGSSAYFANLSSPIAVGADTTFDLWGSFIMDTGGTSSDAALSIFHGANPTSSTEALASFGLINDGNVRLIGGRTMGGSGNVGLGTSSVAVNQQNLYVFKITIDTNAGQVETASLWLNPTLSAGMTESSLGTAAIANVNLTNTGNNDISAIGLYSTSPTVMFDEIRLGNSVADVIVIPEPSTWLLLMGGCALLFFLRRRNTAQKS